ncbi:hypothetical protein I5M45_31480, partial [Pseudomonas aeruginosa]|nr:hypothetical protein [Pseudomonas aeruginosa]
MLEAAQGIAEQINPHAFDIFGGINNDPFQRVFQRNMPPAVPEDHHMVKVIDIKL